MSLIIVQYGTVYGTVPYQGSNYKSSRITKQQKTIVKVCLDGSNYTGYDLIVYLTIPYGTLPYRTIEYSTVQDNRTVRAYW